MTSGIFCRWKLNLREIFFLLLILAMSVTVPLIWDTFGRVKFNRGNHRESENPAFNSHSFNANSLHGNPPGNNVFKWKICPKNNSIPKDHSLQLNSPKFHPDVK